jgi:hypothetical protein
MSDVMSSLARQDEYGFSDLGVPVGAPPSPDAPQLPEWADASRYEPQVGMWPAYKPPKALPDVGPPLVSPGPQISAGQPWANRVADVGSRLAFESVVPQTPLDVGMTLATGPGRAAYKLGSLAVGAALEPSDAEAANVRALRQATEAIDLSKPGAGAYHRIGTNKLHRPLYEIPVEAEGKFPGTDIVAPSWLKDKIITPLVGDPTSSGIIIKKIDDIPLNVPLKTRGGHGYIRETEGYANEGGLATATANRVKKLAEHFDTDQIFGTHTKMGPQSGDFSHHIWGALARMMPEAKMTGEAKAALDEAIKAKIAAIPRSEAMEKVGEHYDWPKWAGVGSRDLERHLASQPDAYRKAFINAVEAQRGKIEGVPDVLAVRYATTDPELLYAPAGASGLSMTRLTGDVVPGSHPDFTRHLTGEGNVSLGKPYRQELMFPDIVERFDTQQPPHRWGRKMYMPPPGSVHGQKITDRWINDFGRYQEGVEQMGELAAFNRYAKERFGWPE